jgi:transcriptional regulator with XRE-family HTH domain
MNHSEICIRFGKNLKKIRIKKGLTQQALADKTGIEHKYIQRLEGKKPPAIRIDTIARFAKALKVSPREFL